MSILVKKSDCRLGDASDALPCKVLGQYSTSRAHFAYETDQYIPYKSHISFTSHASLKGKLQSNQSG